MIWQKGYLDRLVSFRDEPMIKIVTGIRRCGKTALLRCYRQWLREQGVQDEQIIALDLEEMAFEERPDHQELCDRLEERLVQDKMNYIFLEEIRLVRAFPKVLNCLGSRSDVDLYVTSSNASMLSEEAATQIAGKYVEIAMLPVSFSGYKRCLESGAGWEGDSAGCAGYLEHSSFPYALSVRGQPGLIRDHLEGLYSTIVASDIVNRRKITDTVMLRSVLRFVCGNIGKLLSSKKIADTMAANGRKIDAKTVEKYLDSFVENYVLYRVKRYDIKGKQYLKTLEKYYVADMGLRQFILGTGKLAAAHGSSADRMPADGSGALENVVYLELIRRGYEVYVGKVDSHEVDFVARDGKGTVYIQVVPGTGGEGALDAALIPLRAVHDHHPKYILTLAGGQEVQYDGIRCIDAAAWLLERV